MEARQRERRVRAALELWTAAAVVDVGAVRLSQTMTVPVELEFATGEGERAGEPPMLVVVVAVVAAGEAALIGCKQDTADSSTGTCWDRFPWPVGRHARKRGD